VFFCLVCSLLPNSCSVDFQVLMALAKEGVSNCFGAVLQAMCSMSERRSLNLLYPAAVRRAKFGVKSNDTGLMPENSLAEYTATMGLALDDEIGWRYIRSVVGCCVEF
jgi:hypothetical protein